MAISKDYDIILFTRIREDDRLALNTLFAQYYNKLCSFANGYLHHTEEAEECVADVFVNIWKGRKHLFIEKSFKAYIYAAVKHAAIATIRKRDPAFEDIDSLADEFREPVGTDDEILFTEFKQHIETAIETLPDRCRQVFLMSRVEALSYKKISEILGVSEKTIENHLVKAVGILRSVLHIHKKEKVQSR